MRQGKKADSVDVPWYPRRNLTNCHQSGLLEDVGGTAAYHPQVMVDVPQTFVLGEAAKVVAIDYPAHQRTCKRVAKLLIQSFLPTHDDGNYTGLCQVLLAYEVKLGKDVTLEEGRLINEEHRALAIIADEVEGLMDLPEHRGWPVGPGEDAQGRHALAQDLHEAPCWLPH